MLFFSRTKKVKGKKQKKIIDSGWKTYYGSNKTLIEDLEKSSPEVFKREILEFCYSKAEANYRELREQMLNDVLFKPDEYYNSYIGTRISRKHFKHPISFS